MINDFREEELKKISKKIKKNLRKESMWGVWKFIKGKSDELGKLLDQKELLRKDEDLKEEIEHCISYAVKEGYLDDGTADEMTDKEKEDYYNRCMAYDLDIEETEESERLNEIDNVVDSMNK